MPLFRGTFLLKRDESSVSNFKQCVELWVTFEKSRIMGAVLEKSFFPAISKTLRAIASSAPPPNASEMRA